MNKKKVDQPLIVFLIDDDREDQWIFTMFTREISPSIICVVADSGVEALTKLKNDDSFLPHLIFIDMNMPCMNGMQCLREIKKIDRLLHIPVYLYSTSAEPHFVSDCKRLGAVDVIKKEADLECMKNSISRIFQEQSTQPAGQ